jgi:hypothetical protein
MCTRYNIYVIKFVRDFRQVGGFLRILGFSSYNKTDRHNIAEACWKWRWTPLSLTLLRTRENQTDLLRHRNTAKQQFNNDFGSTDRGSNFRQH